MLMGFRFAKDEFAIHFGRGLPHPYPAPFDIDVTPRENHHFAPPEP